MFVLRILTLGFVPPTFMPRKECFVAIWSKKKLCLPLNFVIVYCHREFTFSILQDIKETCLSHDV